MLDLNNLCDGSVRSVTRYTSDYITYVLNSFKISAVYLSSVNSVTSSTYLFDLQRVQDIDKLPKALNYIRITLKADVALIQDKTCAFGLVVYNNDSLTINFKNSLSTDQSFANSGPYTAHFGLDTFNKQINIDFKKYSHLLIAGTTGSGKSVMLNSMICSMFYSTDPYDFDLYFIDLKLVELSRYNRLPNCKGVANDVSSALTMLQDLESLMNARYREMSYRQDTTYQGKHVFCIIDELADLMMSSRYEVEPYLISLAQKARASNIHLILATQRPQVSVVTGLLKANIPNRICLKCASVRDSMTILDHKGGEKLRGNGDALIKYNDKVDEIRFQGVFITKNDIDRTLGGFR